MNHESTRKDTNQENFRAVSCYFAVLPFQSEIRNPKSQIEMGRSALAGAVGLLPANDRSHEAVRFPR
jgi:hypothetical protein